MTIPAGKRPRDLPLVIRHWSGATLSWVAAMPRRAAKPKILRILGTIFAQNHGNVRPRAHARPRQRQRTTSGAHPRRGRGRLLHLDAARLRRTTKPKILVFISKDFRGRQCAVETARRAVSTSSRESENSRIW